MFSISSDVDDQPSWYGMAWRRHLSERFGLQVGDSVFPFTPQRDERTASFFVGRDGWNRTPQAADSHSSAVHLFREWHRHNIDHFHSWSSDSTPAYRFRLGQTAPVADGVVVPIPARPEMEPSMALSLHLLRLEFDGAPPSDLSVRVEFGDGISAVFDQATVRRGALVQEKPEPGRSLIELALRNDGVESAVIPDSTLVRSQLKLIALSTACVNSCGSRLVALELAAYSRLLVRKYMRQLAQFQISPTLITSHGGYSYAQNYLGSDRTPAAPTTADSWERVAPRARADDPTSSAYLTDMLSAAGTIAIWPLDWQGARGVFNYLWRDPAPAFEPDVERLYTFQKTLGPNFEGFGKLPQSVSDIKLRDSTGTSVSAGQMFCKEANVFCNSSSQGAQIGALVMLTLNETTKRSAVIHAWHTHVGTALRDDRHVLTNVAPFPEDTLQIFRLLGDRQYNFSAKVREQERIWVVPPSRLVLYRLVTTLLAERIKVDDSRVSITSVVDPVTRRKIPDPARPSRDLHGVTIYVADAERARIFVDDVEIYSFVINPRDASGRPSVTIVDATSAKVILDESRIAIAPQDVTDGAFEQQQGEAVAGKAFFRLTASAPSPRAVIRLNDVALYNASHLRFALRVSRRDGATPVGKPFIRFIRSDGRSISVQTGEVAQARTGAAWWQIARPETGRWLRRVVGTSDLNWAENERAARYPVLPSGPLSHLVIGLDDAKDGDVLDVDDLAFLRPNANDRPGEDTYLVAGQVTAGTSEGAADIPVTLRDDSGVERQTLTDSQGYYLFNKVVPRSLVSVYAREGGRNCYPRRGRTIDVAGNEAEVDIGLDDCDDVGSR